jgi:hypothetical protein
MLVKMVKNGEGCYIGVECLGIAKVANLHVIYYGLDEDLHTTISGIVSLVVLESSSPGSFSTNAVDARSFRVDCWVIAGRTGSWAYKGSVVVVEIAIRAGNKAPQVVDTIDAVVGGLEKDRRDGVRETDEIRCWRADLQWGGRALGLLRGLK